MEPRKITEIQVWDIWEGLGISQNGHLCRQELATVCRNIGLEDISKEELDDLFIKLDRDGDGRISFPDFQSLEDSSHKTATPSLLSGYRGFHLFSSIDDGTGFGNPEQIMTIWEEEGIESGKEILTSLDFNVQEQVNLLDLTTTLENELIETKHRFQHAALALYKHGLHHQHIQTEQVTKERDKLIQNLQRAENRNLQLTDEVDAHNSIMESLNENKIKDLEQKYKQRLSMLRLELESEKEHLLQQTEQLKEKLKMDLANSQMEQAFLREKLNLSIKENSRLQLEIVEIGGKFSDSESRFMKLQASIDDMVIQKNLADLQNAELFTQEEKYADIIREYKVQCRELRDQNDELQIELETLQSQKNNVKDKLFQLEDLVRQLEQQIAPSQDNRTQIETFKTKSGQRQNKLDKLSKWLEKRAKSHLLEKDVYLENAQLMKALQVTEQRSAEKRNYCLEEKIAGLTKVFRRIAAAPLPV